VSVQFVLAPAIGSGVGWCREGNVVEIKKEELVGCGNEEVLSIALPV
jgi:hypothetical protein